MIDENKVFDPQKSPLSRVYVQFSVVDPGELTDLFFKEDQKLMIQKKWDYRNPDLLPNQIKRSIEKVGLRAIRNPKERRWIRNILAMWYHHAISCAIWRYGDRRAALRYSKKALILRSQDNPNRITRLLYLLIRNKPKAAEKWACAITAEPEKTTAQHLLDLYREGRFFEPQI